MQECEQRELERDERVLDGDRQLLRLDVVRFHPSRRNKDGHGESLPKRGEDEALDAEEFGHRPERLKVGGGCDPEKGEAVEGERYREVVDDGDVRVCEEGALAGFADEERRGTYIQNLSLDDRRCTFPSL